MLESRPPVFLVGMPASGKSTLGKQLARQMNYEFADLDKFIEQECGMSISECFAKHAERGFREIEHQALKHFFRQGVLLSTGGGTACFFDNIEQMLGAGVVVYLDLPLGMLKQRLLSSLAERPLFAGLDEQGLENKLNHMLSERRVWYEKAQLKWNPVQEDRHEFVKRLNAFIASGSGSGHG